MSKFKVGDKVKLKDDLIVGGEYGVGVKFTFRENMQELKGKKLIIQVVKEYGEINSPAYRVCGSECLLDEEMLEYYIGD